MKSPLRHIPGIMEQVSTASRSMLNNHWETFWCSWWCHPHSSWMWSSINITLMLEWMLGSDILQWC